jgi:uncharacterized protein (TIGR00255 family)
METEIAERVRQGAARGRITVTVKTEQPGDAGGLTIDSDYVAKAIEALRRVAKEQGVAFEPTSEIIWNIAVTQRGRTTLPDIETAGPVVLGAFDEAFAAFVKMRAVEGAALKEDLTARIDALATLVGEIGAKSPAVVPAYRELLLTRLRGAGLELELSDERVLKEVALFADRCDVSEELTRLASHLAQLRALLGENAAVGRKAEFLMQEVGRELNTIGSKANDIGIARLVIEGKNESERIREQIANVE